MLSNDAPFKLVRANQLLENSQKFPSKGCLYKFPGSFMPYVIITTLLKSYLNIFGQP